MKKCRETFHCLIPKCIRDQWSHSVALFQAEHSVQMDVNLMRSAHFQWGVGAAERPTSSSQSESMSGLKWTGPGSLWQRSVLQCRTQTERWAKLWHRTARTKTGEKKRNGLPKWQITLTAATSSLPESLPWSIASMSLQKREETCVFVCVWEGVCVWGGWGTDILSGCSRFAD